MKLNFSRHITLLCVLLSIFSCHNTDDDMGMPDSNTGTLYAPYNTSSDIEAKGGVISTPIYCKGGWVAQSQNDWISVSKENGVDDYTLQLNVGYNLFNDGRCGRVRIALANDTTVYYDYTVNQGGTSYLFTNAGYEKGVGYGYNVGADYPLGATFAIFDINRLVYLQQHDRSLYFVEDDLTPYAEEENYYGNTRESVSRQLSANASFDLTNLIAKVDVKGSVTKSYIEEKNSQFAIKRTKRILFARDIQYANIVQYYHETQDSSVFAPGFFEDYKKIEGYNSSNDMPSAHMVNSFLDKWGIGIVARAFYGGSVDYNMQIDKSALSEEFSVSLALDAKVAGDLVKADGSVGFEEKLARMKEKYSLDIYIHGGDVHKIASLIFGESIPMADMQDWINSLRYSQDKNEHNAVLMDIKVASIANLFTGKVAKRVKNYIDLRNE